MSLRILIDHDVEIPMRDGTVLRVDVYRQEGRVSLPVLLSRTPYGKGYANLPFAILAAERGYAVVIQDVRGRWASEGENYPLVHEKEDGFDTLEWIDRQEWSGGKVGMYGESYLGYTQWAAAVTRHPTLKTIIPDVTFTDPYEMIYNKGVLALGIAVSWGLLSQAQMEIEHFQGSESEKAALWMSFIQAVDGMTHGDTFRHLPLQDVPLIGSQGIHPFFLDILAHPQRDAYWERLACPTEAIQIPVFQIGGWYDIFINSTMKDFTELQEKSSDSQGYHQQRLMVGPWVHGSYESKNGDIDFTLQASWMLVLPEETQLQWFDYWLKGIENGIMDSPPIRIFVMGENVWREEEAWPLERAQYTPYYLHSSGAANSLHGDGSLSPEMPGDQPADSFLYDPRNPVPTRGGGLCCWEPALSKGAFDQREVEARPDVLVYTTPPLARPLEVTGPLQVNLWVSSTAPDTDFTAKLVDVRPDGYARNLADGILRMRYREPSGTALLEPADIYPIQIQLNPTSNLFLSGHRLRLEISSSNFPRYARNLNTGEDATGTVRTALNTLLHDADHPSHIVLPVIPR